MVLCGCAGGPGLSFPISLNKAVDGNVVSLKSVAQDGRTPYYQSAKSVKTQKHWPQPGRQTTAMSPSHPIPFRSHPTGQAQQQTWNSANQKATPLINGSQHAMQYRSVQPQRTGQHIQQVAQQQSSQPIVIQWDDHKQSSGSPRSTRTYSTSTFNAPINATSQPAATQHNQVPQPFCPPQADPSYTVQQQGDGCGESGQVVDFEKINKLVLRVEKLESELSSSNQSIKSLTTSLAAARFEIRQMKKDADFWQSEVVRLERSMKAQHRSDIASLNQISQVLETLLIEEESTPATESVPPDFDLAVDPFAPVSR